jgi:hypothetical protein
MMGQYHRTNSVPMIRSPNQQVGGNVYQREWSLSWKLLFSMDRWHHCCPMIVACEEATYKCLVQNNFASHQQPNIVYVSSQICQHFWNQSIGRKNSWFLFRYHCSDMIP